VLPEIDLEGLVADGLDDLAHHIHSDSVLPAIAGVEFERRREGAVLALGNVDHPGGLFVLRDSLAPVAVGEPRGVRQQMAQRDGALRGPQLRVARCVESLQHHGCGKLR
jgi:hypothetical protein